MSVLQRFGVVLLRSAAIWCRFVAFCKDLVPFCCVLQGFGVVLLRSAVIWCRFAMFCCNLERYRVVRRPPFKSGAAVHVEHANVRERHHVEHVDLWRQRKMPKVLICDVSAIFRGC